MSELEKAFLKAQKQFKAIPKLGFNPHFKSKFIRLDDLVEGTKDILNDAGLSFRHTSRFADEHYFVGTQLYSAGGLTSAVFEMPLPLGDPQKIGAGISYARRFTLGALLGIPSEEDQDGENIQQAPPTEQQRIDQQQSKPLANRQTSGSKDYKITPKQQGLVFAVSKSRGWTIDEVGQYLSLRHGLSNWQEMSKSMLDALLKIMETFSAEEAINELMKKDAPPPPTDETIPF